LIRNEDNTMTLHGFYRPLLENKDYVSLARGIQRKTGYQMVYGLSSTQATYLTAGLINGYAQQVVFLAASSQSAKKKVSEFKAFLPGREILLFPDLDPVPFGAIAQSREVMTGRLEALHGVIRSKDAVLVLPAEALMKRLMPPGIFAGYCLDIEPGQRLNLSEFAGRLADMGYERVDMVEGPGHFSIRGGIFDIYPPAIDNPVRIELFDDEVDSIRNFNIETQRSQEKLNKVSVLPAKEAVFPADRILEALPSIRREFVSQKSMLLKAGKNDAYKRMADKMGEIIEKLEQGLVPEGIDGLFPFIYPDGVTLLDYFSQGTLFFIEEPSRQKELLQNRVREQAEIHVTLLEQGMVLPTQVKNHVSYDEISKAFNRFPRIGYSLLPRQADVRPGNIVNFSAKTMHMFKGKTDLPGHRK
jgi:transcription-repair coupling factor (superfamily II helicase)